MNCEVRTCRNHQPRKGAIVAPGFCLGHVWLWVLRDNAKETRAEFVSRQEAQDMLRGRTLRDERRAA